MWKIELNELIHKEYGIYRPKIYTPVRYVSKACKTCNGFRCGHLLLKQMYTIMHASIGAAFEEIASNTLTQNTMNIYKHIKCICEGCLCRMHLPYTTPGCPCRCDYMLLDTIIIIVIHTSFIASSVSNYP